MEEKLGSLGSRRCGGARQSVMARGEAPGGCLQSVPDRGREMSRHEGAQIGMQAGRVLPLTRWANPHRVPVKRRISARDSEAGPRGQPATASGAIKPAKKRQTMLSASPTARLVACAAAAASFLGGAAP